MQVRVTKVDAKLISLRYTLPMAINFKPSILALKQLGLKYRYATCLQLSNKRCGNYFTTSTFLFFHLWVVAYLVSQCCGRIQHNINGTIPF